MFTRRDFVKVAGATGAWLALGEPEMLAGEERPQVAITMDDPKPQASYGMTAIELNQRILGHLRGAGVHAALFVCGMRVNSDEGRRLLSEWNDSGHMLGNHSYSHMYLHSKKVTLQAFCDDVAKGEQSVAEFKHFRKIFRFPYFKEGDTQEKRDGVRRFLAERGYLSGRATIDASDWAIDARLAKRLRADPKADVTPYRDFYLSHIWERAEYYDRLAVRVLGKRPRHTLLIHHSLLSALFLGDLLRMFEQRQWKVISADKAYKDAVYKRQPQILPAGESLVWALAREAGKFDSELRYPGEDSVYEDPRMDALNL